ncbi:hypothetical protein ACFQH8_02905 [Halomicroarcula sp. GCM10025710]
MPDGNADDDASPPRADQGVTTRCPLRTRGRRAAAPASGRE